MSGCASMQSSVGHAREESKKRLCLGYDGSAVKSAARFLTLEVYKSCMHDSLASTILSAVLIVLVCFYPVWWLN